MLFRNFGDLRCVWLMEMRCPLHETLIFDRMKGMLEGCAYDDKGASAYSGHECSSGGGNVQLWCDQLK